MLEILARSRKFRFLGHTYLTRFSKTLFFNIQTQCIQFCYYISEWEYHPIIGSFLNHDSLPVETKITTWATIVSSNYLLQINPFLNFFFFVPYRVAHLNSRGTKKSCFKRRTTLDQILEWTHAALERVSETSGRHSVIYQLSDTVGFTVKRTRNVLRFIYHSKIKVVYEVSANRSNPGPSFFIKVISVFPVE